MPKKLKSKKAAKSWLPKANKWVLALIIILLPFLIYFLIVRPLQVNHQRNQFKKAEVQLNSLADQIQAKIGKADQIKIERSCGYANTPFTRGPRSCSADINLLYSQEDLVGANSLMSKTMTFSNEKLRIGSASANGQTFTEIKPRSGSQVFYQNFHNGSDLSCTFSYAYPARSIGGTAGKDLEINLGCSGPAMAELYPVQN
jgi:hypothetical protein